MSTPAAREPNPPLVRAFVPFALAYLVCFLLRSSTAVAAPEIAADLVLGPRELGIVTSAYFLGYGLMQIPAGMLLDRFGPRLTDAGLLLIAAVGVLVFALAGNAPLLGFGRFLVGVGTAAGLLAGYKANALWSAPERLPLMNGLHLGFGGIGATFATTPTELVIAAAGWRTPFVSMSVLALAAVALVLALAPRGHLPPGRQADTAVGSASAIRHILGESLFWRLVPVTVLTQASYLSYQTLWAGPWLREVAGLGPLPVANHLFALSAAMMVGYFLTGFATTWLGRLRLSPAMAMALGTGIYFLAQIWLAAGRTEALMLVWVLYGVFGTSTVVSFALLVRHMPPAIGGRTTGVVNFMIIITAFVLQAGIGHVVELAADAHGGHLLALRLLLGLQMASFIWLLAGRPWRMVPAHASPRETAHRARWQ